MTSRSAQETVAITRPDVASVPSVPPPCVYAPHGAPKTRATWKAAMPMITTAAARAARTGTARSDCNALERIIPSIGLAQRPSRAQQREHGKDAGGGRPGPLSTPSVRPAPAPPLYDFSDRPLAHPKNHGSAVRLSHRPSNYLEWHVAARVAAASQAAEWAPSRSTDSDPWSDRARGVFEVTFAPGEAVSPTGTGSDLRSGCGSFRRREVLRADLRARVACPPQERPTCAAARGRDGSSDITFLAESVLRPLESRERLRAGGLRLRDHLESEGGT